MPQPELPGVEIVMTLLQINGDVCQNVMHFITSEGTTNEDREGLANAVADAWRDELQGEVSTGVNLFSIKVSEMSEAPWLSTVVEYNEDGTHGGDALPPQLAVVSSLYSTGPGRRGRGRIFLGGFTDAGLTASGLVDTSLRASCKAFTDSLIGGISGGGVTGQLGVWSRADGIIYPAVNAVVDNRWDVQRRRANRRVA